MIFDLPQVLTVNGHVYEIRTDFRDILNIVLAFNDPDLSESEKAYVCLYVLYVDFETIPAEDYNACFKEALRFIDGGSTNERVKPRTMDWEQDASILFPAVNSVAGFETRSTEYLHWWTFLGYFMEIKEGTFSTVLHLRSKKIKNKKLEKWEKDFWQENIELCKLKPKYSREELEEQARLKALLG